MKFLSLFSGIEACSVAWKPLGWECVGFSEIEPYPCSLLTHHYPDVPNKVSPMATQACHTDVPHNGKPASKSARYKALGNSMAVPVMRYIAGQLENAVNYNRIER